MPRAAGETDSYDGLRSFIAACDRLGEIRTILHADWNLEIGALTETVAELIPEPPALLFDRIKGYEPGYRVLSLPTASRVRMAIALGLPPDTPRLDLLRHTLRRLRDAPAVPPREVATGPVMQNVMRDREVNLGKFPAILAHRNDGGRYIGTGSTVLNRDPDSGYVNMATYRMQIHETNLLGLWHNPGQQGRVIAEKYWKRGESCPVAATFGGDFLLFMLSYMKFPWGVSELERAGGVLGGPVEVINGPLTGLPIPAHAEIAIEGEIPPLAVEARDEGPFGEFTGYYAGGTLATGEPQPVIRVKAVYHRNDPIILNMSPQWPGAPHHSVRFEAGALWDHLEAAGIPAITGVYIHMSGFVIIAIEQKYAGHDRQTAMAALGSPATFMGRFVVIVDHDIDPSNLKEVMWAMSTRTDPVTDVQIVDGLRGTPMDPRMSPERKAHGPHTSSRVVVFATRPWQWRDKFPMVNRIDPDQRKAMVEKYGSVLPFPRE